MFNYSFSRLNFESISTGDILEIYRDKNELYTMYWSKKELEEIGSFAIFLTQYAFRVKSLKQKEEFIPPY